MKDIVLIYSDEPPDELRAKADELRKHGFSVGLRNPQWISEIEPCEFLISDDPKVKAYYEKHAKIVTYEELIKGDPPIEPQPEKPATVLDDEHLKQLSAGPDQEPEADKSVESKPTSEQPSPLLETEELSDEELKIYLTARGVRVDGRWGRDRMLRELRTANRG